MTSGNNEQPISPSGIKGPAQTPTQETFNALAKDPYLMLNMFKLGAEVSREASERTWDQAKDAMGKKNTPAWRILLYTAIIITAIAIIFLPYDNIDSRLRWSSLGFLCAQASRLIL